MRALQVLREQGSIRELSRSPSPPKRAVKQFADHVASRDPRPFAPADRFELESVRTEDDDFGSEKSFRLPEAKNFGSWVGRQADRQRPKISASQVS